MTTRRLITWHYIAAQPNLTIPEQWQARVDDRSVAAVMRAVPDRGPWRGEYTVLMVPPGDDSEPVLAKLAGCTLDTAKASTTEDLRTLGW